MIIAALSAADLLQMWDKGATSSGQVRALHVLRIAYPDEDWDSLLHMSIGRRDLALLRVREHIFGERLTVVGACPRCGESVELELYTGDLAAVAPELDATVDSAMRPHQLAHGGLVIDFRLPDSADLDVVAGYEDGAQARQALLDRCVLSAMASDGSSVAGSDLPAEALEALDSEMDRLDPLAVTEFAMACPTCAGHWKARLELSEIVLAEIGAEARLLMREVAELARHYHWSEQSILAMSPRRRRGYLDLAGA